MFGNGSAVEFVPVTSANRFENLRDGNVDILASSDTHTMMRDVYEVRSAANGDS